MEALLILLLIVILIVLLSGNSGVRSQLNNMQAQLDALQHELRRQQLQAPPPPAFTRDPQPAPPPKPEPPLPPTLVPEVPLPPPILSEPEPPVHRRPLPQPDPPLTRREPAPRPEATPSPAAAAYVPPPPAEPQPGFFERHPDLEKFIGENLISKIGIAILVIGIGFFVKFAIDQNWIGAAGRVAIGMLCGGILIALAHRLHRSYKAFSSVLVGGGLAVCFYTISLAYQDYHLMAQPVAFGIMILLTAFACVLALLYDRQEVAVIALVGGFTAPFLVSNGSGNYVVLFSYLLVLNTGLLIIAYRKSWRLLNAIAFGATALLFGGWLASIEDSEGIRPHRRGFWFAAVFYLLFFAVNLAHNIRHRQRFIASDFSIILANTALFFGGGLYMLEAGGLGHFRGLFAICLALLNFGITAALARRKAIDKTVLYLLIGITLSFVSLTAPLQLHGHSITLFWGAETVVLLWMYQKTRYSILQVGFGIVWACSIISLLLDWEQFYFNDVTIPIIFNRGFLTTIYIAAAQLALFALIRRDVTGEPVEKSPLQQLLPAASGFLGIGLLYLSGVLELYNQIDTRAANGVVLTQYLLFYTMAFSIGLLLVMRRYFNRVGLLYTVALILPNLAFYLISCITVYGDQASVWATYGRFPHFSIHWLSLAGIVLLSLRLFRILRRRAEAGGSVGLQVAMAVFGLLVVSVECGLLVRLVATRTVSGLSVVDENYRRIGLPIIWGLYSFVLMWLGMRGGQRVLRITSLAIFSLTLLKLFLVDIRNLGPGGKIAAFCSLGVLLLVVSFMYQRLRRLIIDDKNDETPVE